MPTCLYCRMIAPDLRHQRQQQSHRGGPLEQHPGVGISLCIAVMPRVARWRHPDRWRAGTGCRRDQRLRHVERSRSTGNSALIARRSRASPTRSRAPPGPLDGTVSNVISGAAPYGRIAYEYQLGRHDLEVGVYGATSSSYPGGGSSTAPASLSGPVNQFRTIGGDLQYQFIGEEHLFSLAGDPHPRVDAFGLPA